MKLQLFKNKKGLIYGVDPRRISCEIEGVLKIGREEVKITKGEETVMPLLANGSTGEYKAIFTDASGNAYVLKSVIVKRGLIQPPSKSSLELMELNVRADMLEDRCAALEAEVARLDKIFDTNSLNFLICKGDIK